MHVDLSQEFRRPPDVVFRSIVTDHIRNHPRWERQMDLWPVTAGPVGLGRPVLARNRR